MKTHLSDCATNNAPAYPPGKCNCRVKKTAIRKHSVCLNGRATSVSLEDDFWVALGEIAESRGVSVSDVICAIEGTGLGANLSSGIRLFVLREVQGRAA